jgi:hypothetical protein
MFARFPAAALSIPKVMDVSNERYGYHEQDKDAEAGKNTEITHGSEGCKRKRNETCESGESSQKHRLYKFAHKTQYKDPVFFDRKALAIYLVFIMGDKVNSVGVSHGDKDDGENDTKVHL